MYNFCVFGGTTEGRRLAEFLSGQPVRATVCVATGLGRSLLEPSGHVTVKAEKMPPDEIIEMFEKEHFNLVIDATHPYAGSITNSIRGACAETGLRYLRLSRPGSEMPDDAEIVGSAEEAASFLKTVGGKVLLTTGAKEAAAFKDIPNAGERLYARVLPTVASIRMCEDAGIKTPHIIAMQGPFSEEMDSAHIRSCQAEWVVTKDGGQEGGFEAKASAARECGAKLIVIRRPSKPDGLTLAEVIKLLENEYGLKQKRKVTVVGIGPGSESMMLPAAQTAVLKADCIIGAERMTERFTQAGSAVFNAVSADIIAGFIREHEEYSDFAVLMSGDTGFYSGAKKLLPLLEDFDVTVIPGISSMSYLSARAGKSYDDAYIASLHGRDENIERIVSRHGKVFVLTGGENGVSDLCRRLTAAGLGGTAVTVGERLSYPDEKITRGTAEELENEIFDPLSAVIIENPEPDKTVTFGLDDDVFARATGEKGVIPMTKSEIRAVVISKLRLTEDAVCWDIGAGTGSVSAEMALAAARGYVFAVEKDESAAALAEKNRKALMIENMKVIKGSAPEACRDLPAPTHVFIGGSSGSVREIIETALGKNPEVRIVATAIALETVAEMAECMKEFGFSDTDAVCVNVARARKAGNYNLMTAGNPVYVFTMQNRTGGFEK